MLIPLDYKELLSALNKHRVRYLIIGAYAVIYYTEPRYTKDLDIWVEPEVKNAQRVYAALKEFGAPLKDVREEDFLKKTMVYQIGIAPVRVDILMGVSGIEFQQAWEHRRAAKLNNVKVNIMGIGELLKAKQSVRRKADILDLENLKLCIKFKKE